jgi:hypothetical protein
MSENAMERFGWLIGEWSIEAGFHANAPAGRVTFEWMPGERFIVERWEVPVPEAPDGLAILGFDEGTGVYMQHYFDSRGVARIYKMSFEDRIWKLWRDTEDFSSLDFLQRYEGTLSEDGRTVTGAWEICHDGAAWDKDFDLTYMKVT